MILNGKHFGVLLRSTQMRANLSDKIIKELDSVEEGESHKIHLRSIIGEDFFIKRILSEKSRSPLDNSPATPVLTSQPAGKRNICKI